MLSIVDLTCEHGDKPLGLSLKSPRFSWKLRSDLPNTIQTSYQITLYTVHNNIIESKDDYSLVWKGNIEKTKKSVLVQCNIGDLLPGTKYRWDVTVTDNHDFTATASSAFETGLGSWNVLSQVDIR